MPPQAADLEEALKKKGGLTLSQLANYDDIITDALVDRVYFWSSIRKLKSNYHACRGVQEENLSKIIHNDVIINKDPTTAQEKLLSLPGLAKYHKHLKTADEKEHFVRHLRKYINIYLPDCPFDVGTTNRYTVFTAEAAVYARKPIRKGESVKFLTGIQVQMTEKEERELSSRTDFSIVLSSRRKRPSLFLGPARFANHDCDSNARLNTTGAHGIHIVARKDIDIGDEITVTYGEDYFGEDNCECLCATCESLQRNGWDPRGPLLHEDSGEEETKEKDVDRQQKRSSSAETRRRESASGMRGKRKAADIEEPHTEEGPAKRRRGRPRKSETNRPQDEDSRARAPNPAATSAGRGKRKVAELDPNDGVSASRKHPRLSKSDRDAAPQSEDERDAQRDSFGRRLSDPRYIPSETILERVLRVLEGSAERSRRYGMPPYAGPAETYRLSVENRRLANEQHTEEQSGAKYLAASTNKQTPESTVDRPKTSPNAPKGNLPSPNRSRFSSLRNVVNAETESGIYSIRSSPVPHQEADEEEIQAPLPKRGRGRPRKHPLIENPEDTSSPSPNPTKDSSAASSTSSATSMEVGGGGNPRQLGSGDANGSDADVTSPQEKSAPINRTTRSSLACSAQPQTQGSSQSPAPARGGTNRSPRRAGATSTSAESTTQAVRSIEKAEGHRDGGDDGNEDQDQDEEEEAARGPPRTPGDYHLSRALLPTAYHRWVECRNCDEFFVQGDAYLTRIACPRCERHSKLYGYHWPKTEPAGKLDREPRVTDHRTIHRFIDPEDERHERKGRKTVVELLREREASCGARRSSESEMGGPVAAAAAGTGTGTGTGTTDGGKAYRASPRRSSQGRRKAPRATM